ncbi:hypothetical protein AMECASPLE_025883 [Ameca splendens]|uniref:Uncharacterized protein n=1 Tax=Ameca splendens TaxID=208324 RepID=A0ABV0YSY2_9TELE
MYKGNTIHRRSHTSTSGRPPPSLSISQMMIPFTRRLPPPHTPSCAVSLALLPLWISMGNLDELTALHCGEHPNRL